MNSNLLPDGKIIHLTEEERTLTKYNKISTNTVEATKRAKDEAEKEDDLSNKTIKAVHLTRILPKLLLDL